MDTVARTDCAAGNPQSAICNPQWDEPIVWRVHSARERPLAALGAAAVIAALVWGAADLMQSLWWGLFAAGFLGAVLSRFFFPSEFRIDADGITARYALRTARLRWREIRRFLYDDRGAFVSTRKHGSMLDLFRGMHLIFGENRELAVARIRGEMHTEGRQA